MSSYFVDLNDRDLDDIDDNILLDLNVKKVSNYCSILQIAYYNFFFGI